MAESQLIVQVLKLRMTSQICRRVVVTGFTAKEAADRGCLDFPSRSENTLPRQTDLGSTDTTIPSFSRL